MVIDLFLLSFLQRIKKNRGVMSLIEREFKFDAITKSADQAEVCSSTCSEIMGL